MNTEFISARTNNHIAVVMMSRPPVNAVNQQFIEELIQVFDAIGCDQAVHVIVFTGRENIFCAGADLKDPSRGKDPTVDAQRLRRASDAFFTIAACRKPTIAAINGPTLGAGLVLAASCDILIAAENAFLKLPEVGVGLLGGARHARRLLGHSLTRRMMLTGYRVAASELYRIGAIEKCVPHAQLMQEALAIAAEIASKDPAVVQLAKQALNDTDEMSLRDGYAYEQRLTLDLMTKAREVGGEEGRTADAGNG